MGRLRRFTNGLVVAVGLVLSFSLIALAGRIRARAGRTVAGVAIRCVSRAAGISYTIHGVERLDPTTRYMFVPNHSSPIDIPAMLHVRSDVRFLAAAELFRVPLLSAAMRALGAVPIDRANPAASRRRLSALAEDTTIGSLVVFAEGGIPRSQERRPFKTGAFALAIQAGISVVPVSILGSADILPRGRRIWARPGRITVEVHEPISTAGLTLADRRQLRDRTEAIVRIGTAHAA